MADALANVNGSGRHLNLIALASLSYPATKAVIDAGAVTDRGGYRYDAKASKDTTWVFSRKAK